MLRVVEAAREERERGLARATRADERDRGSARDLEVEVVEYRAAGVVTERHAFEAQRARACGQVLRVRVFVDVGLCRQHLGDARRRRARLRPVRQEVGPRQHRRDQQRDVLHEPQQVAGSHAPGRAEVPTQTDDDQHRGARPGQQRGVERGPRLREADAGVADARGSFVTLRRELRFESVPLDDAHTLHLLLDELRPLAELLLQRKRRRVERASAIQAPHDADTDHSRDRGGEHRLDEHEDDDTEDEHRGRLDRPRDRVERLLQRGDVGRRARHELARAHPVVERERQALEVLVEAAAQVVRDERRAFRRLVLAHRAGEAAHDAEGEDGDDVSGELVALVVDDDVVDRVARHERGREDDDGVEARTAQCESDRAPPGLDGLPHEPVPCSSSFLGARHGGVSLLAPKASGRAAPAGG